MIASPDTNSAVKPPPRRVSIIAAFDFDGTITTSDSLRDFVRHTVGSTRLVSGAILSAPWLAGMLLGVCGRGIAKERFLAATLGGMTRRVWRSGG